MVEFITKEQAVKLIKYKDFVGISGSGGTGSPEGLLNALKKVYDEEQKPKNITVLSGISPGNLTNDPVGFNLLCADGLVGRSICAHYGMGKTFQEKASNNQFAAYAIPLGVYTKLLRAIANQEVGFITKTGLNTFVDPRMGGAKVNKKALKEKFKLTDLYLIDKKDEVLYFKTFPINVALIKGSIADKKGNISLENEPFIGEQLDLCAAVKNSGGIVICEVTKVVANGKISPKNVAIHNSLVDYVVVHKPSKKYGDYNWPVFKPELIGEGIKNDFKIPLLKDKTRLKCIQKALKEIKENEIVNLGVGMPSEIATLAYHEKKNNFLMSVETGPLGGIPLSGFSFGASFNPEALYQTSYTLDLYNGGFLDTAILGLAEVDKNGNVNVSKFNNKITGPGGFIDITQNTKNIIFLGTLTTKNNEKKFKKQIENNFHFH